MSPSQASSGTAAAAERAKTKVSINFAANGTKSFRLFGKITPKANHKTATLLRASKANGHYGKARTAGAGHSHMASSGPVEPGVCAVGPDRQTRACQ